MTGNMFFRYMLPKHIKSTPSNSRVFFFFLHFWSSIFGFLTGRKGKKTSLSSVWFCISCSVNHNLNVEKKIELFQIMWNIHNSLADTYCTHVSGITMLLFLLLLHKYCLVSMCRGVTLYTSGALCLQYFTLGCIQRWQKVMRCVQLYIHTIWGINWAKSPVFTMGKLLMFRDGVYAVDFLALCRIRICKWSACNSEVARLFLS